MIGSDAAEDGPHKFWGMRLWSIEPPPPTGSTAARLVPFRLSVEAGAGAYAWLDDAAGEGHRANVL